jgi:hypothetical protein
MSTTPTADTASDATSDAAESTLEISLPEVTITYGDGAITVQVTYNGKSIQFSTPGEEPSDADDLLHQEDHLVSLAYFLIDVIGIEHQYRGSYAGCLADAGLGQALRMLYGGIEAFAAIDNAETEIDLAESATEAGAEVTDVGDFQFIEIDTGTPDGMAALLEALGLTDEPAEDTSAAATTDEAESFPNA